MAKQITYREQEKIQNTMKLREFLSELPPYAKDYFRAKEPTTSDKTRLSYMLNTIPCPTAFLTLLPEHSHFEPL